MKIPLCDKCGKVMKISGNKATCHCGFEKEMKEEDKKSIDKMKRKEGSDKIMAMENMEASYPHKCSKCGYEKAEVIMTDPWYSDADYNIRFRCGKCGHVERERLVKT